MYMCIYMNMYCTCICVYVNTFNVSTHPSYHPHLKTCLINFDPRNTRPALQSCSLSLTSHTQEPGRPPPPFSSNTPVVPSLLYSYSPAPAGLPSHRSTASVSMAMPSVHPTQVHVCGRETTTSCRTCLSVLLGFFWRGWAGGGI